jgi:hypothetical protein
MLIGFAGLLASSFFLSQGYSIFSTLYFALAAAVERLRAGAGYQDLAEASASGVKPDGISTSARVDVHDTGTGIPYRSERAGAV